MSAAAAPGVRTLAILMAAVGFLLSLPSPASAASGLVAEDALENAVVYRINTIRSAHGLRKLAVRPALKAAGTKHATNMAVYGYFRHSWSNGTAFGTWIQWFWPGPGYTSWSAGENLYWAAPDTTARQVVRAWMNSSGHRANILRSSWRAIGVGAVGDGTPVGTYRSVSRVTIVAAEFGRRS